MKYFLMLLVLILVGCSSTNKGMDYGTSVAHGKARNKQSSGYKNIGIPLHQAEYKLVAKDSLGLILQCENEIGFTKEGRGTIIMESNREYVVIDRDGKRVTFLKNNVFSKNILKVAEATTVKMK